MSGTYHASVFNQPQSRFEFAAENATRTGPRTMSDLRLPIERNAPRLEDYISRYVQEVVQPFADDLTARGQTPGHNKLPRLFTIGAYMTYAMVRNIYLDTGAELPHLSYGLPSTRLPERPRTDDPEAHLIDVYYRGAEFRERMPHVYGASLIILEEAVGEPAARAGTDLDAPIGQHRDIQLAWEELHFMGGVAETALVIEERAAQ